MTVFDSLGLAELLYMALVMLFAYVIKGMAGFGSGLLAVPLLALVMPITMVVPMLGLISYTGTIIQSYQHRKQVVWHDCFLVLPFALVGVLLAVWIFKTVELYWLNKALAVFVMSYAVITLLPEHPKVYSRRWGIPAGFLAGLVGTLFGTGGPFYVVYLKLRKLDKSAFRATIVMLFLFDGAIRISAYSFNGFYTKEVLVMSLSALPVLLAGLWLGHHVHLKISKQRFNQLISLILLVSGVALFFK